MYVHARNPHPLKRRLSKKGKNILTNQKQFSFAGLFVINLDHLYDRKNFPPCFPASLNKFRSDLLERLRYRFA